MEPNVQHFMNAQHCLAIAAGFIATIAACATLISSANNKAESLATRIRSLMKEYREPNKDSDRCSEIEDEICLFKDRFVRVQKAQRSLFFTIGTFIIAFSIFISFALYAIYKNIPEEQISTAAHIPVVLIIGCLVLGLPLMLIAIFFLFREVKDSYATLCIETRRCPESNPDEVIERHSVVIYKAIIRSN